LQPENLTVFLAVYRGYTATPLSARYRHAFNRHAHPQRKADGEHI
jgi:hypothetical protein